MTCRGVIVLDLGRYDLSKTFDTLEHKLIEAKLFYYGLTKSSVGLFLSHFKGRKQLNHDYCFIIYYFYTFTFYIILAYTIIQLTTG